MDSISRRELLKGAALAAAAILLPVPMNACSPVSDLWNRPTAEDEKRLKDWVATLRKDGLTAANVPVGNAATRVGALALGTPYEAFTLEQYIKAGGDPTKTEPLTLSLTKFDCVTLVESCIAVARVAQQKGAPTWNAFARDVERMRYRGGVRRSYTSRLHYFSEWISDGEKRGLVRDIGKALGGVEDIRPLRFMTEHRGSYPALKDDLVFAAIGEMERGLDSHRRFFVPTDQISSVVELIRTGDVLAFTTSIPGLDVSHAAFAYEDPSGVKRVLHAPLSGGVVQISKGTIQEYVEGIKRATGILVARPL